MPIRIVDVPDPFSQASREAPAAPPCIESDAYQQLLHELRRYCNGELSGRSFLITGHRGAGKTTLVSSAFDALLRGSDIGPALSPAPLPDDFKPLRYRPLPVLLQGPTLLPNSDKELPFAMDGTGEAGRRLTEMENVLVQITLGLHRALAREMVLAFRVHADYVSRSGQSNRREMDELAAQFALELDDYSGKPRLRDLWRRAGAMRLGVLYALRLPKGISLAPDWTVGDRSVSERLVSDRPLTAQDVAVGPPLGSDQSVRELVALMSVCEAYRRISGKISRKDQVTAGDKSIVDRSLEVAAAGKDVSGPLIAALTGAAVGTAGVAAGIANARVAALAGILTALAGMVVGKTSIRRTRERSASLEDLFIPDLSVATLDRILPVLIDRLRDAGLAPIFVVDELDKVERLSDRIQDMIRRLKKMVAESACFCFLADRSYFEEMRARTAASPYSIEHTYFTHQLFIAFRHTDVRQYLMTVLKKPDDVVSGDPNAVQIREEQADHTVLPYILMHGAQMHAIDLQRQISQMRDRNGNVILSTGLVRSRPRYQLELLVQLAIEIQLEQDAMQGELDRRPPFRRLAHDALYFVSRQWEEDNPTLSLTDEARSDFARYLLARMVEQRAAPKPAASPPAAATSPAGAPAPGTPPAAPQQPTPERENAVVPHVSPEDLRFLWEAVRALAQSLAAPQSILAEYEKPERGTSEVILAALREAIKLGPLLEPFPDLPLAYRWMFRRSGRKVEQVRPAASVVGEPAGAAPGLPLSEPVTDAVAAAAAALAAAAGPPQPPTPPEQAQTRMIRAFENVLKEVTGGRIDPSTLSAGLGILPTSPAWPQVSAALARLETLSATKTTYPEHEDDLAVVGAYVGLLRANVRVVALSLHCGMVLTAITPANTEARLQTALDRMAHVLDLHELSPDRVVSALAQLTSELGAGSVTRADMPAAPDDVNAWIEWMAKLPAGVGIDATHLNTLLQWADAGWGYWQGRLQGRSRGQVPTGVVLRAVAGTGAFGILKLPLDAMTLRDWSVAFYESIGSPDVPPWLAVVALARLGWEPSRVGVLMGLAETAMLFGEGRANVRQTLEVSKWTGVKWAAHTVARVFVSAAPESIVTAWKPDGSYAALVLEPDEWLTLRKMWTPHRDVLFNAFHHDLVAVDISAPVVAPAAPEARPRGGIRAQRADINRMFVDFFGRTPWGSITSVPLIVNEPPSEKLWSGYMPIARPRSFEDIFARVRHAQQAS